jgi:hypothetical protein
MLDIDLPTDRNGIVNIQNIYIKSYVWAACGILGILLWVGYIFFW